MPLIKFCMMYIHQKESAEEIVSDVFAGKSRIERHRLVNDLVSGEFKDGVHALAIKACAPGEPTR